LEDWAEVLEMLRYSARILDNEKRKQMRTSDGLSCSR